MGGLEAGMGLLRAEKGVSRLGTTGYRAASEKWVPRTRAGHLPEKGASRVEAGYLTEIGLPGNMPGYLTEKEASRDGPG